ncbi:MAG: DUF1080 domain-containing protein [Planctomycetes bacterium]|nr:DUF1080 domain-containing protein [Planctomycetota bacterium]
MANRRTPLALALACACACAWLLADGAAAAAAGADPEGWIALFDGKTLDGWWTIEPNGSWSVEDGEIACNGSGTNYFLLSRDRYENFELEVEYLLTKDSNSGLTLHIPDGGRESKNGIELQILGDAGRPPTKGSTGAIYDVIPPREDAAKPAGEWNRFRVIWNWPRFRCWLNGREIHDVDFSAHPELNHRVRRGYIGLQDHHSAIRFRGIRIRVLPGDPRLADPFAPSAIPYPRGGSARWCREGRMIAALGGGGGWIASPSTYESFALYAHLPVIAGASGIIYIGWRSDADRGEAISFFEIQDGKPSGKPVVSAGGRWIPVQVFVDGGRAIVRMNGRETERPVRPGRIALYAPPGQASTLFLDLDVAEASPAAK